MGGGVVVLLFVVFGDWVLVMERILIGVGLGVLGGVLLGWEEGEVVVIYLEDDLELRLCFDFVLC